MTRDEARSFLAAWETEHALLSRKPLYELVAIAQSECEPGPSYGAPHWTALGLVSTIMTARGLTSEKLAETVHVLIDAQEAAEAIRAERS